MEELRDANGSIIGTSLFYIGNDSRNHNRPIIYYTCGKIRRKGSVVQTIEDMDGHQRRLTFRRAARLYPLSEDSLILRIEWGLKPQEIEWISQKVVRGTEENALVKLLNQKIGK